MTTDTKRLRELQTAKRVLEYLECRELDSLILSACDELEHLRQECAIGAAVEQTERNARIEASKQLAEAAQPHLTEAEKEIYYIGTGRVWSGVAFVPDEYIERIVNVLKQPGLTEETRIEQLRADVQRILDEAFVSGVHFGPLWGNERPHVDIKRLSEPACIAVSFWYHAEHNAEGKEWITLVPESKRTPTAEELLSS